MGLEGERVLVVLLIDEIGMAVGGFGVDDDMLLDTDIGVGGGGGVAVISSTGFLERFLPLCMCLSQYLESG